VTGAAEGVPLPPPEYRNVCPLCGTPAPEHGMRCVECNYHLGGVGGRPVPWTSRALWVTVAAFLALFVITIGIVALTH